MSRIIGTLNVRIGSANAPIHWVQSDNDGQFKYEVLSIIRAVRGISYEEATDYWEQLDPVLKRFVEAKYV